MDVHITDEHDLQGCNLGGIPHSVTGFSEENFSIFLAQRVRQDYSLTLKM
jgi:hypothetical protein